MEIRLNLRDADRSKLLYLMERFSHHQYTEAVRALIDREYARVSGSDRPQDIRSKAAALVSKRHSPATPIHAHEVQGVLFEVDGTVKVKVLGNVYPLSSEEWSA